MLLVSVLSSAYLTYLITDATITQPARETLLEYLRRPTQNHYKHQLAEYQDRVRTALDNDATIPTDAPAPPPEPPLATLLTCRWCAGMWTSGTVTLTARLTLTAEYLPFWPAAPLSPLDVLIVPAWALANAYAIGYLSSREGT